MSQCLCVCDQRLYLMSSSSVIPSDPSVYDEIMQPVLHSGYLYKSGLVHRGTLSRKTREGRRRFKEESELLLCFISCSTLR